MGNCLTSNKIVAHDEQPEPQGCGAEVMEETGYVTASKLEGAEVAGDGGEKVKEKKKKMVRFKLDEDNDVDGGRQGESKNGVVRVRLVVTQTELKQILSSRKDLKHASVEQLIRAMKLRGIRVSEAGRTSDEDGFHGGWRPALESIAEED